MAPYPLHRMVSVINDGDRFSFDRLLSLTPFFGGRHASFANTFTSPNKSFTRPANTFGDERHFPF